jgi:hypothetical protein
MYFILYIVIHNVAFCSMKLPVDNHLSQKDGIIAKDKSYLFRSTSEEMHLYTLILFSSTDNFTKLWINNLIYANVIVLIRKGFIHFLTLVNFFPRS